MSNPNFNSGSAAKPSMRKQELLKEMSEKANEKGLKLIWNGRWKIKTPDGTILTTDDTRMQNYINDYQKVG